MAGPILKACKSCSFLSESDSCPRCGNPTSAEVCGVCRIREALAERD